MTLKTALRSGGVQIFLLFAGSAALGLYGLISFAAPLKVEREKVTAYATQKGCVVAFGSPSHKGSYAGLYRCSGLNPAATYSYDDLKARAPKH